MGSILLLSKLDGANTGTNINQMAFLKVEEMPTDVQQS